jgi:hypothetical protein
MFVSNYEMCVLRVHAQRGPCAESRWTCAPDWTRHILVRTDGVIYEVRNVDAMWQVFSDLWELLSWRLRCVPMDIVGVDCLMADTWRLPVWLQYESMNAAGCAICTLALSSSLRRPWRFWMKFVNYIKFWLTLSDMLWWTWINFYGI